jgi:hypothetical protein
MKITKQEFLENFDYYVDFSVENYTPIEVDFGNSKIIEMTFRQTTPTLPKINKEERRKQLNNLKGIIKDPVLSNLSDKEIKELVIEERTKKYTTEKDNFSEKPHIDKEERAKKIDSFVGILGSPDWAKLSDKELKEMMIEEKWQKYNSLT